MRPQAHSSAAIVQLRGWVMFAAAIVCLCGLTQALVFTFANYTTVRQSEIKPAASSKSLRVVAPDPSNSLAELRDRNNSASAATLTHGTEPVDPNQARSPADAMMARASAIASGVGTLACFALCLLTLLGVVVGAGANVPGVEKCVTAGVWSIGLALLCLPWADALPSLRIPGMFASYAVMTAAIDASPSAMVAGLGMYVQWLAMPIVASVVAVGICIWFRVGVERGVIITAPSELERAIEREAAELSKQGVSNGVARSVGALNRAVGELPATGRPQSGSSLESAIESAASVAGSIAEEISPSLRASGNGRAVADSGYKRLI